MMGTILLAVLIGFGIGLFLAALIIGPAWTAWELAERAWGKR